MDVIEAIYTTRAMRRLDPNRDVSGEDLLKILEAATMGPTGSNSQPVRWLVVRDAELRKGLGEIYRKCWRQSRDRYASSPDPADGRLLSSADHLADHMGEAPAIIIPCTHGLPFGSAEGWPPPWNNPYLLVPSSVFPAVQNLCLAARALGLGTTITGVHRRRESEVKELLGLPEEVTTWGLIPVGYPLGKWGRPPRRPVRELAYWDAWGQPPPI